MGVKIASHRNMVSNVLPSQDEEKHNSSNIRLVRNLAPLMTQTATRSLVFRSGPLPFSHLRLEHCRKERQCWSPTSRKCLEWQNFAEGRNGGSSSPQSNKCACGYGGGEADQLTPGGKH